MAGSSNTKREDRELKRKGVKGEGEGEGEGRGRGEEKDGKAEQREG